MGLTLALAACGANEDTGGGGGGQDSADQSEGGIPVGVILPETATSARWEGFDKPMLEAAIRAEGLDPDIQNAQGDVQKFTTLADGMIASGVLAEIDDAEVRLQSRERVVGHLRLRRRDGRDQS